ncbi:MAG: heme exporter protein CcmD [Proteobacteria bacterium]|nr:heme exporter protein CcmD [Pseudomonadota bacterium]
MPEFQFSSIESFLQMGGYAAYVWLAYFAFLLFVVFNIIPPIIAHKAALKRQKRLSNIESDPAKSSSVNQQ